MPAKALVLCQITAANWLVLKMNRSLLAKKGNPALSSKLITREEFRRNNLHASELAKSYVFKWPRVDGQWADTKLELCLRCHGKGHSSDSCTVKKIE